MLRWIVQSSLKFRLLVTATAAGMLFLGVAQLRNAPVDVLPEFSLPYVEVQTEALGLSAEEVEQLITVPLEADLLNGVAWLKTIRSDSIPGLSSIVLIFEPGTHIMRARQMVQERLTQAHALPNVSKPPVMLQPLSSTNRAMTVGMTSKDVSHIDMSVLARWTIRPRLMGVPGVANVAIWGQRKRQLQVRVDPVHLKEKGVKLRDVIKTTGEALWVSPLSFLDSSTPGTGGWIDTPNQRLGVRHVLPISTADQLAKVSVEGKPMILGDLANVEENHQLLIGDSIVNDGPGLLLVIEKFPWANTLDVTRGVEKALEALKPGLSGIAIDSNIFRPATFVETSFSNLSTALLIGSVLVSIAFFAFFYNWRVALIGLVAIPLSLVAAGLVLYLRGVTIDMMAIAGLIAALGVIIDDAIIGVESTARHLRQHKGEESGNSTAKIILKTSLQTRSPIVYATLIILLAAVPAFLTDGLLGAFLNPAAQSYVLAVLASMLVALIVTPALCGMLLRDASDVRTKSPLVVWLQDRFKPISAKLYDAQWPAVGAFAAMVLVGILVLPLLSNSPIPSFKESALIVKWNGAPGTSRQEMTRVVARAGSELRGIEGVRTVAAQVGRAVMSDQIVGVNSSELWVSVDPASNYDATLAKIREVVKAYPGVDGDVVTYYQDKTTQAERESDDDLVVRVYGNNLKVIRSKAEEIKRAMSQIKGVVNPHFENRAEEPTLEIKVDLARAQQYGVKPGDVRRTAATLLSGIEVGSLFEGQKVFDVVVFGTSETRHSLTSVRQLLVDTPGGGHVQLQDVADLRIVPALNVIKREGVARYIDVDATVRGRDHGAVAADVDRKIKEMTFPLEHHAEVLGRYIEKQASSERVISSAIAALIGIFLLLQAAFGSWRLATIVFVALPAALTGGLLAALIGGGIFSIGSLIGLLAVFAIATRQCILLVNRFQNLEQQGGETSASELVTRGVEDRFVPVVLTAAITLLAFLPVVFFGKAAGLEVVHPIAVVTLGGIITSTLLTLYVLPALYLRVGVGADTEAQIVGEG